MHTGILCCLSKKIESEKSAQRPSGGADPICLDQPGVGAGVEPLGESVVQRDLQEERRRPDNSEQCRAGGAEKALAQIGTALKECGKAAEGFGVEIWVEVHGAGVITHRVNGETDLSYEKPQVGGGNVAKHDPAATRDGELLESGSISLQSESHPVEFRKV